VRDEEGKRTIKAEQKLHIPSSSQDRPGNKKGSTLNTKI
jgi:hypothetical protein